MQTNEKYSPRKFDSTVQEIQVKLNYIKSRNHICVSKWEILKQDGLYGPKSKDAVVAFKTYFRFTDKSDRLDEYTIGRIRSQYNEISNLTYCVMTATPPDSQVYKTVESVSWSERLTVVDKILDCFSSILDAMSETFRTLTSADIMSDRKTADAFIRQFKNVSKNFDPELYKLKQSVSKIWEQKDVIEKLSSDANRETHIARSNLDRMKIVTAQRDTSFASRMVNIETSKARQMQSVVSKSTMEINILNKVTYKFSAKTVMATAKYVKPISFIGTVKDLLVDIVWESWHMESEEFWVKFKNDLYMFVDDFIIGHLADWIVLSILAAVGVTVVSGGTIVIVVLGCVLVSSVIGFLLEKNNISFSRFLEDSIMNIAGNLDRLMKTHISADSAISGMVAK